MNCGEVDTCRSSAEAAVTAPGLLLQSLCALTYAPHSASFTHFLMQSVPSAACSKILLQNLPLASEQIRLAWTPVSHQNDVSLGRSNTSTEVNQAFP